MKTGKVNVLLDAFWGSSGKGKLAAFLAQNYPIEHASVSNMPNAGHSVVTDAGKVIFKVLPSAVAIQKDATAWICPGSVFDMARLGSEVAEAGYVGQIFMHERATLLKDTDKHQENARGSIQRIASTGQGCARAKERKLYREEDAVVGDSLRGCNNISTMTPSVWSDEMHAALNRKEMWLHEVSQGWALSLDWGTHYPHCTSRNCTSQGALDEVGAPPSLLGDVYLNIRTYPIRVGNTAQGSSGGWWWDHAEVNWQHVADTCGMDVRDLEAAEMTTVTKRQRRVATFSYDLLKRAARHNGATKIFVNFANYICPGVTGVRDVGNLPKPVRIFVDSVEGATGVKVCGVGTGAHTDDVVWFD